MRKLLTIPLLFLASLSFGASKYQTNYLTATTSATVGSYQTVGDVSSVSNSGVSYSTSDIVSGWFEQIAYGFPLRDGCGFGNHSFVEVVAYKIIDGVPVFSENPTEHGFSPADTDCTGLFYGSTISWSSVSGADGYRIAIDQRYLQNKDYYGYIDTTRTNYYVGFATETTYAPFNTSRASSSDPFPRYTYFNSSSPYPSVQNVLEVIGSVNVERDITVDTVTANTYYGDGSHLTGISSGGSQIYPSTDTPTFPLGLNASNVTTLQGDFGTNQTGPLVVRSTASTSGGTITGNLACIQFQNEQNLFGNDVAGLFATICSSVTDSSAFTSKGDLVFNGRGGATEIGRYRGADGVYVVDKTSTTIIYFPDGTSQTSASSGGGGPTIPSTFTWTISTMTVSQVNGATTPYSIPIGYDFSGNGNLATLNGTVPRGDGFLGVYSASFTGNNSNYLQNNTVAAQVNTSRTLAFWMKTSSTNVIGASWGTTQTNNRLMGASFLGTTTWDLYARGGTNDVTGATTSVNAISGAWTHVAFAYDGAGKTDLYVNGQLAGMARRTSGTYDTSAGAMIGIWRDLNRGFVGLIDDVGFWDVQITTAQIQSLYNGGAGAPCTTVPSSLLAYYSFENDLTVSSLTINSNYINANGSTATFNVVLSTGGSKTKWAEVSSSLTVTGLTRGASAYYSTVLSTGWIASSSATFTSTVTMGNYLYVASSFTVGRIQTYNYVEQVDAPYAAQWDDAAGSFPDEGYCFNFSVRPYKTILGTRVYSPYENPFGMCDNGTFTTNYWVYLIWSNPGTADGYILTITNDDWNAYYSDAYIDVPNTFVEIFYDVDGGIVVGTPPYTPQSLTVISTASYVRGNETVKYDLAVGGNANVTGNITSTGTVTATNRIIVAANTADYANSPEIKIVNTNASGQNAYQNFISDRKLSVWRTDFLGGISWAAGSSSYGNSYRGYHDFYVSGDYPSGTKPLTLRNPYSCQDGTDSVNGCLGALMASGTDNGYTTFDFDHRFLYSKKKLGWLFAPGAETTSTTTYNSMIATVTVEGTGYFQSTFTSAGALVISSRTITTPYSISLSTDQHNYRPAFASVYVASASLPVNIGGFSSPTDGEWLDILNVSTQPILFPHLSTATSQFNRIALSTSSSPVYISSGGWASFVYENICKLWRQK